MSTRVLVVVACSVLASTGCGNEVLRSMLFGPSAVETPAPVPSPVPVASPSPVPDPDLDPDIDPRPAPTPPPTCGDGTPYICPNIPLNDAPVARVGAKLYFLECNGQQLDENAPVRVGCVIHMDCTPKDASGNHTRARGVPSWSVNDESLIQFNDSTSYNPKWTALQSGELQAWVVIDGVRSNTVKIRIR